METRYEITLSYITQDGILFHEQIRAHNLVELYAKHLLALARLQEVMETERRKINPDDIPF